ncbi:unnamed protein product [Caenorhabditis angaria]|uniref:NTF2-like domain-containing protein n=1 Tax=Caenorhabditis angaria TaxID=860376 RepID=A0A9P1I7A9_9PELO|nr:unnamed protein product [Caenorhabditis angaria]
MFSKQFLIIFSISIIGLINANTWDKVKDWPYDIPAVISEFVNKILRLFPRVLNKNDELTLLTELTKLIHDDNLTVIMCGRTLGTGADGKISLYDYIRFERNRYIERFPEIINLHAIQHPEETLNFEFDITMRSSMGFYDNRTIKISAIDTNTNPVFFDNWIIIRVEISGSCVDSKIMNRSLIVNEWVPLLGYGYVNKTAENVMNDVIKAIPFNNKHFFDYRSTIFFKHVDSEDALLNYFAWVIHFLKHFKHRAELNSFIISENIDHIVFRTSHVFENIKNNEKTENWHFIIEVTCEHLRVAMKPHKRNEVWTIKRMQFRPDYDLFNNIERQREALMEEVDVLIEEIENVFENRPTKNANKIEWYGRALQFFNPELVPKHDNKSDLFKKVFEVSSSLNLEKCDKILEKDGKNLMVNIYCQYWYLSSENRKLSRKVKLEIIGGMDSFKIEAIIRVIRIFDPIKITTKYRNDKIYSSLSYRDTVKINFNYFADLVTRLLIGQSSYEYLDWENNFKKLVEYTNNKEFHAKICGKSYKNNAAAAFFKKYLERNRKTTKLSKFDIELFTINEVSSTHFKIVYTSINSMGFLATENYTFSAQKSLLARWTIESVGINGSCIYENLNIDSIHSRISENVDLNKEINEVVNGIQIPYIENENNINVNLYSENFEGYIAANPNIREVYQLPDFTTYLRNFVEVNKLRQRSNSTIIKIEPNSFVVMMSMIFDHFIFHVNQSSNDEWMFFIEGSRNAEKKWEIIKLVMSPRLEFLTNNITQRRAATYHMLHSEHDYSDILKKVKDMPRNSSHPKLDIENCESRMYNLGTALEFHKFFIRFVEFLKLSDFKTVIDQWRKPPVFKSFESFSFEIKYELTISGIRKAFVVNHFAEYNFKHGYYHDTKLELTCPVDIARYYKFPRNYH